MKKETLEQFDNIFNNLESNDEKLIEFFIKIENWAERETNQLKKRYSKKLENYDLFNKLEFTNAYKDDVSEHMVTVTFSAEVDNIKKKGKLLRGIKWYFKTSLFLLVPEDSKGVHDLEWGKKCYKSVDTSGIKNIKFNFLNEHYNIDNMIKSIESIDLENIELLQIENFSIENELSGVNRYNRNEILSTKERKKIPTILSGSYSRYKIESAKKFNLIEKIKTFKMPSVKRN